MQTQNQIWPLIVSLEVILQTQMFLLALLVQGLRSTLRITLSTNTTYYFRIASLDVIGNVSAPSSDVSWSIIPGCVDSYASNTSETANLDDGSCTGYPDNGNYSLEFNGVTDRLDLNAMFLVEHQHPVCMVLGR